MPWEIDWTHEGNTGKPDDGTALRYIEAALRFTTAQVEDGTALRYIECALDARA